MRWIVLMVLMAGCSGQVEKESATDDPAVPEVPLPPQMPADVVLALGNMTLQWEYESDGFEAWTASLYFPEPASVTWHPFPQGGQGGGGGGGGGNGVPELVALVPHPMPGQPCQDFTPALEIWNGPGDDIESAQVQPGLWHVVFATDNTNGAGGLDINGGNENATTGPRASPFVAAAAMEESTGNFGQGAIDASLAIEAVEDGSWLLWAQGSTGPSFLPRADNGFELRLATDDGCYEESVSGPGPVTTEQESLAIHGGGSGATALTAVYEQQSPTSGGDTQVQAAALYVVRAPGNLTAPMPAPT